MLKKCKVVMLPTEKTSKVYRWRNSENREIMSYTVEQEKDAYIQPQHLYFLSDEEIKEGDWVICDFGLHKAVLKNGVIGWEGVGNSHLFFSTNAKKVIASTDKSLGLPEPPDKFIQKYCELGGVSDVMVEYEDYVEEICGENGNCFYPRRERLKITSNNTIVTHPSKESWTREEVIKLLKRALQYGFLSEEPFNTEDWIRENL